MKLAKRYWRALIAHPILATLGPVLGLAIVFCMGYSILHGFFFSDFLVMGFVGGIFVAYPFALTILNLIFAIRGGRTSEERRCETWIEGTTLVLGVIFTTIVIELDDIKMNADWSQVLHDNDVHTPIHTADLLTVLVFLMVGIVGYLILRFRKAEKTPPLVFVLAMAMTYLGAVPMVLWIVQFSTEAENIFYGLLPLNCLLLIARVIHEKIRDFGAMQKDEMKSYRWKWMNWLNAHMCKAGAWPLIAFVVAWPLLGLLLAILCLFGQEPDAMIRAWTQTSEWRLSTKVSPPNIRDGGHYLCTVAAGGHRKVVKPERMGVRLGEPVVVNRQLCVANAFEQMLMERAPKVQKSLRHFYDTYGFPIAKMIHSPWTADLVYVLMKPLEWLFLVALYLFDAKPENRIAMQYIRPLPKQNSKK